MEAFAMQRNQKPVSKLLFCLLLALSAVAGCGSDEGAPPASIDTEGQGAASSTQDGFSSALTSPIEVRAGEALTETPAIDITDMLQFPEVRIETTKGDIYIRLNAEKAPVTVDNFLLNYVDQQFYDNTIFHYVDDGYMIAAGGYTTELRQKTARDGIPNEAGNGLKNVRGTIAMARYPDDAESANCQFFINLADNPSLDHKAPDSAEAYGYCVFGEVTQGMDVVDSIANVAVEDRDQFPKMPLEHVGLLSIRRLR